MSQFYPKAILAALVSLGTVPAFAEQVSADTGVWSGSLGVVNKYVYRGSEENDKPAVQAGLEYAHNSGVFAGYWGSMLNYDPTDDTQSHGFEHDFYVGYGRELNENWSYKSQITAYVYQGGGSVYNEDRSEKRRTTGVDFIQDISYKDLTASMAVLLSDVNYGNAGDVYLNATYSYALPYDVSLNSSLGVSVFNDSRDDSLLTTTEDVVFTEARLGLSKPIADTGFEIAADYVWGGKDREGEQMDDNVVVGLTYSF
ncbi:TorF family putative porin [Acinetobacter sp. YH12251]|uniref:TorF family putative porin n=1 Tax=Acinetobacter sp. YH12251 TaxID=2601176 RepID=UPI0015D41E9A|nr:TorF family putative porin [Acinetobacter sp. YH12251]